jgi:transposase
LQPHLRNFCAAAYFIVLIWLYESNLEFIAGQLARVPTRAYLCRMLLLATASIWALLGIVLLVERTFSWFGRNRRLARDFENLAETLATLVTLASIQLALRRFARA